jgi:hypothetical protein
VASWPIETLRLNDGIPTASLENATTETLTTKRLTALLAAPQLPMNKSDAMRMIVTVLAATFESADFTKRMNSTATLELLAAPWSLIGPSDLPVSTQFLDPA